MNVLITGASRGIGLAMTEQFIARGDRVYAVCRESTPELTQAGAEVITGVDITRPDSLNTLRQALDGVKIDTLVNNAGLFTNELLGELDFERIAQQFQVNSMGALRVVETLLPNMGPGGKIVNITSRMGSIADNSSGAYYGYRMSKAALNAASVSLARDLQKDGIAVAVLHPGFVQTQMVGFAGDVTPEQAAAGLIARMDELTLETSGGFWHANGEALPW